MRYLDLLTALFATVLLVSNVASTKLVGLGPFTFDGGTLLFPLAYIFGDVLTEVYGYRKSRRVIWIGFFALLLATLTFQMVAALPAPPDAESQRFGEAFGLLFGLTPRIVLGSLLAYFLGEFANAYVLAKLKVREVMARPVVTVEADAPLEKAALLMEERKIGGLPVMEGERLVGIITVTDVLRAFIEVLGLKLGGLRITVDIPDVPGALAQMAQAVPPPTSSPSPLRPTSPATSVW